jgi:hypothetical protein
MTVPAQALDRRDLRLRSGVGHTAVQGKPPRLANQATAWAMLPALAVHTPFASSSSDKDPISEPAPRILKEPIGCRTSSFR